MQTLSIPRKIILSFVGSFAPAQGGRYSNWLGDGLPRGWSSCASRGKIFLMSMSLLLTPIQPPIQRVYRGIYPWE
jgi:hypothetical protein